LYNVNQFILPSNLFVSMTWHFDSLYDIATCLTCHTTSHVIKKKFNFL